MKRTLALLVVGLAAVSGQREPTNTNQRQFASGASLEASKQLLLQLVDALIDACELQLDLLAGPQVGAIHPDGFGRSLNGGGGGDDFDPFAQDEKPPSTHPMNWRPKQADLEQEQEQEPEPTIGGGCWKPAMEWLKAQLLATRMQLLLGNHGLNGAADAVVKLAQLADQLADVCTGESSSAGSAASSAYLQYISRTLDALAQVSAEVDALSAKLARADQPQFAPNQPWADQFSVELDGQKSRDNKQMDELALEVLAGHFAQLQLLIDDYERLSSQAIDAGDSMTGPLHGRSV